MNIYDKVHELGKALKECDEIKEIKKAAEKINSNESNKKMIEDFRKIQAEAYAEQSQRGELSKETKEKIEKLAAVISLNPDIANYLQCEARFATMWQDIMQILNDAIDFESLA